MTGPTARARTAWPPRSPSRSGWPGPARPRSASGSPCARPDTTSSWRPDSVVTRPSRLPRSLKGIAYCTDVDLTPEQEFNVVTVTLAGPVDIGHRHAGLSAGSSACGVCGKDSVTEVLDSVRGARDALDGPAALPGRRTPPAREPARGPAGVQPHRWCARGRAVHRRRRAARRTRGRRPPQRRRQGDRRPGDGRPLPRRGVPGRQRTRRLRAGAEGRRRRRRLPGRRRRARRAWPCPWPSEAGLALYGFTSPTRTVRYA